MNWFKLVKAMLLTSLLFVVYTSSGCCKAHVAVKPTAVKPKLEPLPAEVLQAMQPNSTELSKRAEDWYSSSGKLLDSVTDN